MARRQSVPLRPSLWLRFPRVFGGPALAERHAVTHEVSVIFKLRVLETPQARVDILPCALERGLVFDFVHPLRAGGRLHSENGDTRLYESGRENATRDHRR